jgi:hypothetical protein
MLDRLKELLVESFVGAIALGLLLSNAIARLTNGLTMPVTDWLVRTQFQGFSNRPPQPFTLRKGWPELIRAFVLFVIWCGLFYWLYFKRKPEQSSEPVNLSA